MAFVGCKHQGRESAAPREPRGSVGKRHVDLPKGGNREEKARPIVVAYCCIRSSILLY
jgi:hypothetical protein